MKKHKLEFSLAALFVAFVVLLMWETLAVVNHYLPMVLLALCAVFIAALLTPTRQGKHATHEQYAPRFFAQTIVSSILGIAVIIGAAVLLNKNNFSKTFDLTANKVNSLSDESVKFLSALPKQVQIVCVPSPTPSDTYCDNSVDLINLYAKTSKNIIYVGKLNLADKILVQKVQPSGFSRLILLTDNNKSELTDKITESKLTNALMNLVKLKKSVYFLTGSGEPALSVGNGERNYSDIVSSLQAKSYEVKEWNIKQGDLPADARMLVAGDNSITYSPQVETMLTNFVARGGKLLLIVNPYHEQGLDSLYAALNLKRENVLLTLNSQTALGQQLAKQNMMRPPVIVSNFNPASPITSVIAQIYSQQAVMPVDGGQPITVLKSDAASPVKTTSTVLMSAFSAAPITLSAEQRNKIDLTKPFTFAPDAHFDSMKPWPLAVDVEIEGVSHLNPAFKSDSKKAADKSEVVVYGFSLVNLYSKASPVSEELIPLTVAHLYQDQELVSIAARDVGPKPFNLSRNPGAWLPLFAGFLPVATALVGLFIWVRRRAA